MMFTNYDQMRELRMDKFILFSSLRFNLSTTFVKNKRWNQIYAPTAVFDTWQSDNRSVDGSFVDVDGLCHG